MSVIGKFVRAVIAVSLFGLVHSSFGVSPGLKLLHGHVPKLPAGLLPNGHLSGRKKLHLAIGLPLRDEDGLNKYLAEIYDPASTNFHRFLTPQQFTARFGPTAAQYQQVIAFAKKNRLTVTATHDNRLLLDVDASVSDIQRAFHIQLLTYHKASKNRDFFAPDADPSVSIQLPISDVSGLNNYDLPHPLVKFKPANSAAPKASGSGPSGGFIGHDFRAAYLPGVTLTGAGQEIGLLQFDGFYSSDITAYGQTAGQPDVPIQTVLLDSYDGTPTTGPNSGNVEVSLDIEMAEAMAPGLSKIVVFEAGPNGIANDVLNAMAQSNQVKQLSCSWGWGGGPSATTDAIFKEMAAQGQSFFTASGDSDAFTTGSSSANGVDNRSLANAPSSSPYVTAVGGTTLSTGPGGSWQSETVWNWGLHSGSYEGSSGGISSYYSIPSWQAGIDMSANQGSSRYRNIPDVAMAADNIYVAYGNGSSQSVGGTSCAAPLWAGLMALANQQTAATGHASVGFLNPALYALGKSGALAGSIHDITAGNNVSSDSPNLFYATSGYDLCTGWGTPAGQSLIDALSGATNRLGAIPNAGFTAAGPIGGPWAPDSAVITLTNSGSSSLSWSLINTSSWLNASPESGELAAGATAPVSVVLSPKAGDLPAGVFTTSVLATNDQGGLLAIPFTLSVGQSVLRNGGFESGDFSGWSLIGNGVIGSDIYNAVENSASGFSVAHSGNYGVFLGDTQLASLSQTVSTDPGQYYLLSLWLDNPSSGTPQQFSLNWSSTGGSRDTLYSLSNPPAFSWTNLQFLVVAPDTNATIEIQAENSPSYFGVDDVSLAPVPQPTFRSASAVAGGNGFNLSWVTAPGLMYQVQYKTNLAEPNWKNLAAPFAGTGGTLALTDTNAPASSPQRYYRLTVSR